MNKSRVQDLYRLYDRMGVARNGVEVRESEKGLCLYSTQCIPARTAFAAIPFDNIVNHTNLLKRSGKLYDVLRQHDKQLMQLGDHVSLVIWCMYCIKNNQYPQWFNADCSTFLKMTVEELNSCQDQKLKMEYMAYRQDCQKQFQFIVKITSGLFSVDWDTYRKASDFVTTRGFGYRMKETALIPLFDCLNHSFQNCIDLTLVNVDQNSQFAMDLSIIGINSQPTEPEEEWSEEGSFDFSDYQETVDNRQYPAMTHVVLSSSTPILPHSEITLFYGCRNNNYLLKWYGFAIPNNPYDSVHLFLSQNSINFDGIDRPNTKIKLKNKLSIDLVNQARKHFYEQYYNRPFRGLYTIPKEKEYELYFLQHLHKLMKKHVPPQGNFQPIGIMKHVKTYQDEQLRIYLQQIALIEQLVSWVQHYQKDSGVPQRLAVYCRSFIIQQS